MIELIKKIVNKGNNYDALERKTFNSINIFLDNLKEIEDHLKKT